mmetsp:Transcript_7025/g.14968  ORF Transcript_7025/g.14968 Transcript_7025/m.14968 type:complete len:123 (+) Transcript_7025:2462-2830(+)
MRASLRDATWSWCSGTSPAEMNHGVGIAELSTTRITPGAIALITGNVLLLASLEVDEEEEFEVVDERKGWKYCSKMRLWSEEGRYASWLPGVIEMCVLNARDGDDWSREGGREGVCMAVDRR